MTNIGPRLPQQDGRMTLNDDAQADTDSDPWDLRDVAAFLHDVQARVPIRHGDVLLAKVLDASTTQLLEDVTLLWRWTDPHHCGQARVLGHAAYERLAVPTWKHPGPCRTTLVPIIAKNGGACGDDDDDVCAVSDLRFVNGYIAFAGTWIVMSERGWRALGPDAAGDAPRLARRGPC
ncbi:MAG: hypothetical protein QOG52_2687 [Frankiaceae bacterium]|nr:hypothetical protein [Frankiaceae bacterium]